MKKILLILALACMASAVSVANAGPRNPVINTVDVMNDSMYPVNVTFDPFGASAFTFRFPETPVAWFTLRNCNTGEYHFVSPGYALNVTVPVSGYLGTWELVPHFTDGGTCNVLFFVDNYPSSGGGSGSGNIDPYDHELPLMP